MAIDFIPKDGSSKLEFDKLLHVICQYCISDYTRERLLGINLSKELDVISLEYAKIKDWVEAKENRDQLPLKPISLIAEDIFLLRKNGYVLPVEAIFRINEIIRNHKVIDVFFTSEKKSTYPNLYSVYSGTELDQEIYNIVDSIFDEEGEIKPNASPDLASIYRLIKSKQKAIDSAFNGLLSRYRKQGLLTDVSESYRSGRRVLSVPAENKRKIKGIIHDESTTGKTVFIEPDSIISLNNDLFELYADKKKEIYRIIRALCDELRPYSDLFLDAFEVQIEYDIIQSKSAFASYTKSVIPGISSEPILELKRARHPLLHIKNGLDNKKTIAFDLVLLKQNKMLLISGPNAGGKSILMKAVGLLQLMFQASIPVTVAPDSKFGIFNRICIDIGDQQSIEDDLSTYSSRLKNMKAFSESVDKKSLVLIDEFGSGTDPKIGGAIAEALLKNFVASGCFGVITSHYSNLKLFTYKTKGIVNGAMIFDQENLIPTYNMKIGRPGSSFALEIATKTGIDPGILKYAKNKIGEQNVQVEDLLTDLQREKKELESKLEVLEKRSKELERLIKNYEKLYGELEYKRKKFNMEQKAYKLSSKNQENKRVEKLIREIKENQNIEKAKELSQTIKKEKKNLSTEINTLKKDVYYQKEVDISTFQNGDYVRMKTGSEIGQIIKIKKGKAELAIGIMRMFVPLTELLPAKEPIQTNKYKSVSTAFSSNHQDVDTILDIRGFTKGEAGKIVEDFLDKVLLSNNFEVKIIHGVGNGVLKNVVWTKAKEYKDLQKIWHPESEQGGEGVTLIQL